ncbi:MAG: hypothetical protein V1672_00405 [Candidatus Diapherotrites archaeon]
MNSLNSPLYSKPSSTKDNAILILGNEWPLSAKEIYSRVLKTYGLNVSYQAIHKALNELEDENIVEKNGKDYSLSKTWLFNRKEFFESLNNKYAESEGKYDVSPDFEGTVTMKFNDLSLFSTTMGSLYTKKILIGNGPEMGVGTFDHGWWLLKFNFMDFQLLVRMVQVHPGGIYSIFKQDTPFDKWISDQYCRAGFKSKCGISELDCSKSDIGAFGDTITKVTFSEETKKFMDEIYSKIHNLSSLFKYYALDNFRNRKASIKVELIKDPELAGIVRQQVLPYFKEK